MIRELRREDLPGVAAIHLAAFVDSSLTSLGREAVRRYYEWLLNGPHQSRALGAFERHRLVGFSFGGVFNGALTGFLRRNRAYLAVRVATHPWLALSPLFRDRITQAIRLLARRAPATSAAAAPLTTPAYGILAIAVEPSHHGTGVGQALMKRNEELARASGFRRMELSVAMSNVQAIRFYERGGWTRSLTDGVWTRGVMSKELL